MKDDLISRNALLDKAFTIYESTPEWPIERRVVNVYDIENAPAADLDRRTALSVLQDLSSCMYPNYDLYGNKTLVINRDKFEKIRAKYLDRKKE
jgi:hypothetical protein